MLKKPGRPVVQASLRTYVMSKIHNSGHFWVEKTNGLVKHRFFWPNMYKFITMIVEPCETCQRTKSNTKSPRAPSLTMLIPCNSMELVSIDIAHMPVDNDGYGYFLLFGDLFSEFIDAMPLAIRWRNLSSKLFQANGCTCTVIRTTG